MKNEFIFIQPQKNFDKEYCQRSFTNIDTKKLYSENELISFINKNISNTINKGGGINCFSIDVEEGDGMSWTAETIKNKLTKTKDTFDVYCLQGKIEEEKLPQISNLFKKNQLLKIAVNNKIISPFKQNKPLYSFFIAFLAIFFTIVSVGLYEIIKKNVPHSLDELPSFFENIYFYIIFVIALITGLFTKYLLGRKLKSEDEAKKELIKNLKDKDITNSKNYSEFIIDLSIKVRALNFPRFIIIDNFESLDYTTQKVFIRYINDEASFSLRTEIWVVFQTAFYNAEKIYNQIDTSKLESDFTNFRLNLLTYSEKEELINRYDLKEEYSDFTTIKSIFEGKISEESKKIFSEILHDFRKISPKEEKRYGDFELLYLLALNSKPYNIFLSTQYFIENFTKDKIRNNVLAKILFNAALTPTELNYRFKGIHDNFKTLLEITTDSDDVEKLRIKPEIYEILNNCYTDFDLQTSCLVHLFWSLFWGDMLNNHPVQFVWTRKLIFHLLNAKDSFSILSENKNYSQIILNLYNYNLLAINLSIKTCHFKQIFELIENSYFLIISEQLKDNTTVWSNFLKKVWQIYSILHDENILNFIFNEIIKNEIFTKHNIEAENILDQIFFETINNEKIRLSPHRLNLFYINHAIENTHAVRNYFRSLSAWFSLSLSPITDNFTNTEINKSALFAKDYLRNTSKTIERINNGNQDDLIEFDFRILSLSLWSSALKFRFSFQNFYEINEFYDFLDLIKTSLNSTFNISDKIQDKKKTLFSTDYFYKGLSTEIATISISSAMIPLIINPMFLNNFDEKALNKINDIIELINKELNYDILKICSIKDIFQPDFIKSVDNLFELSSLVWLRLGIVSLYKFLLIRRVQFITLFKDCLKIDFNKFIWDINLPLNEINYFGILSNIIAVNAFNEEQLKSYYFTRISKIIIDNNFGDTLKKEFSIIIIQKLYLSKINYDIFFNELTKNDFFTLYLQKISDNEFKSDIVDLTHSMERISNKNLKNEINTIITNRIELISANEIKQEVKDWNNSILLSQKLSEGEQIDIEQILSYWNNKKDSWLFPSILNKLISNGYGDDTMLKESIEILNNSKRRSANTYLFLAFTLYFKLKNNELEIPMNCLKEDIKYWEDRDIDYTIDVYEVLEQYFVHEKKYYEAKIESFKNKKWINDHLELLPELSEKAYSFQILLEYFNSLRRYGLRTDNNDYREYFNKVNIPPSDKVQFINNWKINGSQIPTLFTSFNNEKVINSDFLRIGVFLFSQQLITDVNFENDRIRINKTVAQNLIELFNIIRKLNLPGFYLEIFEDFARRHVERTIPEND